MDQKKEHARPSSCPMNGGVGPHSYALNSTFQRSAAEGAWAKIKEVIMENLDYAAFPPTAAKTVTIADLGCSVGPNTFIAVQGIIDSARQRYMLQGFPPSELPQFQVFFNDQEDNDFNTLFLSLPADRSYFAMAVPGSFYGRLFPESSLNFVHSSHALNWLSKLPEELFDHKSPAFNKGRVHYSSAPAEVRDAFSAQFAIDLAAFLSARSKEMLTGGLMVMILPGIAAGVCQSQIASGMMYDILGDCLMDMAEEGMILAEEVDLFNLPVYFPTAEEMSQLIGRDRGFSIEKLELTNPRRLLGGPWLSQAMTQHVRAAIEGLIGKHFGKEIIDNLFTRVALKADECADRICSAMAITSQLLVVLRR
ncbi:hypothetical protein MLD38_025535 [Melastoma candidum]|uniref:Uncharacterized protein n=1 Tax=Melastoma candidum TaxID=119954 RepID=A0ACB9NWM0_9MYRT|nr:hypothetical protein MLD38_025535 [Melastoma candidum]